jgi:NADP-reducing hydrogenase subunit HndB
VEDLQRFREEVIEARKRRAALGQVQIVVGLGSCGIAAGALDTLRAVQQQLEAGRLGQVQVTQTGCAGLCKYEPIVEVLAGDSPKVTYGRVTPDVARRILREHVLGGKIVDEFVVES